MTISLKPSLATLVEKYMCFALLIKWFQDAWNPCDWGGTFKHAWHTRRELVRAIVAAAWAPTPCHWYRYYCQGDQQYLDVYRFFNLLRWKVVISSAYGRSFQNPKTMRDTLGLSIAVLERSILVRMLLLNLPEDDSDCVLLCRITDYLKAIIHRLEEDLLKTKQEMLQCVFDHREWATPPHTSQLRPEHHIGKLEGWLASQAQVLFLTVRNLNHVLHLVPHSFGLAYQIQHDTGRLQAGQAVYWDGDYDGENNPGAIKVFHGLMPITSPDQITTHLVDVSALKPCPQLWAPWANSK